jgi:hypothetical protein
MQRPKRTHRTSVVGYSERLSREPRQSSRSASSPRRSRPRVRVPRVRGSGASSTPSPTPGGPVPAARPGPRGVDEGVDAHQGACLFVSRALLLASLLGVRASGFAGGRSCSALQARTGTAAPPQPPARTGAFAACRFGVAILRLSVRGIADSAYRGYRLAKIARLPRRTIRLLYTNTKSPCSACKVRNARERALDALWGAPRCANVIRAGPQALRVFTG